MSVSLYAILVDRDLIAGLMLVIAGLLANILGKLEEME